MKVGDYVRTNVDILRVSKIYERADGNLVFEDEKGYQWYFTGIKKSSPNIIDLIEVGDYVNGTKVTMIAGTRYDKNDLHCYCDYCENKETRKWLMIPAKEIKSIVTKEQFESMEYKVEE